jgi:arsenate reductase-like glutaredoxin family protein
MLYVYTNPKCTKCDKLKKRYHDEGIEYRERSSDRLSDIPQDYDPIDKEALVILNMQNMELPVVVITKDTKW